jgi:hypothetical protein
VKAIRTRECLDKQDRRDIAASTFAMSRNKPGLLPFSLDLRALDLARDTDDTALKREVAKENTRLLQIAAFEDAVQDVLKHDARPQSIPQPRWTVAQKTIVTRWANEGLENGSLEPSTSAWSSRVHLVLKPPANQTAELADLKDCKLRPCGDYRLVNTQIDKIAPNLPTGLHQLEQAAGYRMYFEADSVACYNSFRLAPGISREALAVWTPIGLLQPTVLLTLWPKEFRHGGSGPVPARRKETPESFQLRRRLAWLRKRLRGIIRQL